MRHLRMIVAVAIVASASPALADHGFHALPGKGKLQLAVEGYDGSVNGALEVEIRNRGKSAAHFSARGLYFVPDGDPDQAPQRLAAVGPMKIDGADRSDVEVPAGKTVKVTLEVYCVDEGRAAPDSTTAFTVAKHRMPAQVAGEIERRTSHATPEELQDQVWGARAAKKAKLDGEGAQERARPHEHEHERLYKEPERLPERRPEPDATP